MISSGITLLVGIGLGIFVLITNTMVGGIIILGIDFFVLYFLASYFYYLKSDKTLPQYYLPITILLVLILSIGSTIALFFVTKYGGFIAFTVSYLIITFVIGFYASYLIYKDLETD
jgi:hypothetical protein